MLIIFILIMPLIAVIIGVLYGIAAVIGGTSWAHPKLSKQQYMISMETTPEETPFYIEDKLTAYDQQIEAYNALLQRLDHEHQHEREPLKQYKIRVKQADIMLKLATIEEKAYKLREKV